MLKWLEADIQMGSMVEGVNRNHQIIIPAPLFPCYTQTLSHAAT